ncbi:DUF4189 domain-containing protein [Nocardia sp. NPDC088792]|uniref:DUF4189 domain-containing protein n=1 Tax=Nocardia sp. NPDC088792 TaxID=3364332 RepID=UPI003802BCEC
MSLLWKSAVFATAAVTLAVAGGPVAAAERGPDGKYYGSIAYSYRVEDLGGWGVAWNYPSQGSADADAVGKCGGPSDCKVVVSWTDGCASLAQANDTHLMTGVGVGATAADAEQAALDELHTQTILPPAGSSQGLHDEGHIVATQCNG